MNFSFVSTLTFEPWSWRNPSTVGIGGSETSHIQMAQRLARRGHKVTSFAPLPDDGQVDPAGVEWQPWERWKESKPDVFVIYRAPRLADELPPGIPAWLICQDVDYKIAGNQLTLERATKFNRIVALCDTHAFYLRKKYKAVADRVCVSSNGINSALIREVDREGIQRNPTRLMYASSPDRGMEYLLDVFSRAREIVPDLELHVYYGFDNIDKLKAGWIRANAERLKAMTDRPGVTLHGRTPQPELIREWFKAGIWCHATNFTETSCITCMEAQACGAIPITNPVWAVSENVRHGIFIEGDITSDLIRQHYVDELVALASDTERQAKIRQPMQRVARELFDWEHFVDQWQGWAHEDLSRLPLSLEELIPEAVA